MRTIIPVLAVVFPASCFAHMYGHDYEKCSQDTTVGIAECLNKEAKRWDQRLNASYQDLMKRVEPAQQAPAPEVPAQPEATPSTPNAGEATSAPEAPEASDEPDEDTGPPTQAVSAVDLGIGAPEGVSEEEDPFLDELRKAMSDEEPLGPRDGSTDHVPGASLFGEDDDRRGWRFGKRR